MTSGNLSNDGNIVCFAGIDFGVGYERVSGSRLVYRVIYVLVIMILSPGRFFKIGGALAQIAFSKPESLRDTLSQLKGPFMKMAQFLATIPDAIPPQYADVLLTLQSQADPMPPLLVRRRMREELGQNWEAHFDMFDLNASAAASLGQVHKARTLSGQDVACKLQYPDMQTIVDSDLTRLRWALGLYQMWQKAIDTTQVQCEIRERLLEELDYTREAENIMIFQKIFENHTYIRVPDVMRDLSTQRLLTMRWEEGTSILEYTEAPLPTREILAKRLFEAWYRPLYHHNVLHGDPHPGNYLVSKVDQKIILLDFGCIRTYPPKFVQAVLHLYEGLLHNNRSLMEQAYHEWGFQNLSHEMMEILNAWAKLLYGPLLEDRKRPIQPEFSGAEGWRVACQVHESLSQMGGICPPREFVLMDRAAVGIGGVLMRLRVECNWHRLFESLIYA